MSLRRQLREIERERQELLKRDERLCNDLKWHLANAVMVAQLADHVVSLVGWIFGKRHRRRAPRR